MATFLTHTVHTDMRTCEHAECARAFVSQQLIQPLYVDSRPSHGRSQKFRRVEAALRHCLCNICSTVSPCVNVCGGLSGRRDRARVTDECVSRGENRPIHEGQMRK